MNVDQAGHDDAASALDLGRDRPGIMPTDLQQPVAFPGDIAACQIVVLPYLVVPADDPVCCTDAGDMLIQYCVLGSHVIISGKTVMIATSRKMQPRKGSTPTTTSATEP